MERMLLPKEKPYMEGLNSYYLHLPRLAEHMQGEIGCGCIHGKAAACELLIIFDEKDIIRCQVRERDLEEEYYPELKDLEEIFNQHSFVVNIYTLDQNAVFFWGQMPPYQRAKSTLRSSEIPLPDLIFRLRQKQFSGFIEVRISEKIEDTGLLFFHDGQRIGGSYSWGRGGMSNNEDDYSRLLGEVQDNMGVFTFGSFIHDNDKATREEAQDRVESVVLSSQHIG